MAISEFLKKEHFEIKNNLEQEFLNYFDELSSDLFVDETKKNSFRKFIEVIFASCGQSQQTIAESFKRKVHRSEISRKTEQLNNLLIKFCENKIVPAAQVFYHHITAEGKKQKPGCHIVCSKEKMLYNNKGYKIHYSFHIKPFKEILVVS